jgi:transposase
MAHCDFGERMFDALEFSLSQTGGQERLFYSFNLDDHIPPNRLLCGIDRFLDLDPLREHLAPFYSHTGRPSIDPELMVRMLIVGYCFGIRSEEDCARKCI